MTLTEAACHLPVGFMLRIEFETDDAGRIVLCACVYQHAPGWSPGDVFDEANPEHGWDDRHPADRFRDRVLFGITADSPASFERLLVGAILERWPEPQPVAW